MIQSLDKETKIQVSEVELQEYKSLVEKIRNNSRRTGEPQVFDNLGVEHARVVISNMINNGQREILIHSEILNKDTYNVNDILSFLERGGVVKIISASENLDNNQTSILSDARLKPFIGGSLLVKKIDKDIKFHHFMVVDSSDARIETNHDDRKAEVYFLNKDIAGEGVSLFYQIFN